MAHFFRIAFLAASLAAAQGAAASAEVTLENGIDRKGRDYNRFISPSPDICRTACAKDLRCAAFTWVRPHTTQGPQGICWLKSSVPPQIGHHCCVSGVKAGSESDRARDERNYPPGCTQDLGRGVEPRASLRVANVSGDTIEVYGRTIDPGASLFWRYKLMVGRNEVCWAIVKGRGPPRPPCVTLFVTNQGPKTCSVVRSVTYRR